MRQIEAARRSRDGHLGDETCRDDDDGMPFTYEEAIERCVFGVVIPYIIL